MQKKTAILYSPLFLTGLAVLLLNDHVLKASYPGTITGKLSDISGLFIFPIFLSVWIPRYRNSIYLLTAIGFTWWKLPLSQPFIDTWNMVAMNIHRVVDPTDLYALLILPLSYLYFVKHTPVARALNPTPVILITSIAFIATSRSPHRSIEMNKEFSMQVSIDTLQYRMFFHPNITNNTGARNEWLRLDSIEKSNWPFLPKYTRRRKKELIHTYAQHRIYFEINDTSHACVNHYVNVKLVKNRKISKIILERSSYYHCNSSSTEEDDKDLLIRQFENMIVKPISY